MRRASLQSPATGGLPKYDWPRNKESPLSPRRSNISDHEEEEENVENPRRHHRRHLNPSDGYYGRGSRRAQEPSNWTRFLRPPASRKVRRHCIIPLGLIVLIMVFALWHMLRTYEFQFESSVYSRDWVKKEFDNIKPLKGCFNQVSPQYNMTKHNGPRQHMLSPGLSLRRGLSCYDFAATINHPANAPPSDDLTIHSYWRADLRPFGSRQAAAIESFLATQRLPHSNMIIWSNDADALSKNPHVAPFLEQWPKNFQVRQADMPQLTRDTEIDGLLDNSALYDRKAWVDGDALRLLVLWHYGGIWMDMDMLLTRDLQPLLESEFLLQWDCYGGSTISRLSADASDKPYFAMNGALMHFRKHSPYLCEAFHIMATEPFPEPNTFTWGSHLYAKLHSRLIAAHVRPFAVLPWCFADPRNCRADIRFPDPFLPDPPTWAGRPWKQRGEKSGRDMLEERIKYVFTIHLHNQWEKDFPKGGWVKKLVEGYRRVIKGRQAAKA